MKKKINLYLPEPLRLWLSMELKKLKAQNIVLEPTKLIYNKLEKLKRLEELGLDKENDGEI